MSQTLSELSFADSEWTKRVSARPSTLKIVLKTRNDPFLLEPWIRHHAAIVGLENLIVFDHSSTEQAVLDLYAKYDACTVVRFSGFHNYLHDTNRAAELYRCLRASCAYFVFLDTDEHLIEVGEGTHAAGPGLVESIAAEGADAIPSTWIYNVAQSRDAFNIGLDTTTLAGGIKWGKPILKSASLPGGFINHNTQIPRALFGERRPARFFVKHYALLYPQQRIKSNIGKLVGRKMLKEGATVEDALRLGQTAHMQDANVSLYVNEIRKLHERIGDTTADPNFVAGMLRFEADGRITTFSEAEGRVMAHFRENAYDSI